METNELLGRGKVIKAFEENNLKFIEQIAKKRIQTIERNLIEDGADCYFDISKFYIRGLYKGFNKLLNNIYLVFLVRDPLENMKSFMNRKKDFFR